MRKALIVCIGCTWLVWWGHYFVGFVLVYTICWFLVVKSGVISWLLVEKRKHFGNSVQQLNLELGANGEELFSDPAVHALFKYKHFPCNITGPFDGEQIQIKVFWLHHQSGAKWLKRNVSSLQNRVSPHGSLRGQLKVRWLQRKGGKCLRSISMKSVFILNSSNCLSIFNLDEVSFNSPFRFFLFSHSVIVFQFSISLKSLLILCFHLQQRREE